VTNYALAISILALTASLSAQTTYQGLTPGQSRRAQVEAVLRAPVRQVDGATWEHSPLQGTGPIHAQYVAGSDLLDRLQVFFAQPIVRSVMVERVLGNRSPENRSADSSGALVEYYGAPSYVALTYVGAEESRGVASIAYFSRALYDRTLARPAADGRSDNAKSGQEFRVRLVTRIDTSSNQAGDPIAAVVLTPQNYANAVLEGQIRESRAGNKIKGRAALGISFDRLRQNGKETPVQAVIQSVVSSRGIQNADEEGRIVTKTNRVGATALATGLGAVLGALKGGAKGAAIGAGVGAGAALATIELATDGATVKFEPGSEFVLSVTLVSR
jgi:hypothetical protein